MKRLFLINLVFALALTVNAFGSVPATQQNPYDLNLSENIEVPVIPQKNQPAVREAADKLKDNLERAGLKVSKLRRGEVLIISMPCAGLFKPNESNLSNQGLELLGKLKYLENCQSRFKMMIAVHTDDTGDETYADMITSERANAIYDFLIEQLKLNEMTVIPYGIGRDEPLVKNDSSKNRRLNRRVEIYLVPLTSIYGK